MSRLNFVDEYDDHYCKADTDILLTNFAVTPRQVYCDAEDPLGKAKYGFFLYFLLILCILQLLLEAV